MTKTNTAPRPKLDPEDLVLRMTETIAHWEGQPLDELSARAMSPALWLDCPRLTPEEIREILLAPRVWGQVITHALAEERARQLATLAVCAEVRS